MGQLDQQRTRIQDDLRGLISGEVLCDEVFLQLYATDAGIHEIRPLGVVRPRSTADVAACVRYAAAKGIAVHARGAGTNVAGAALGPGLVIDFSRDLRRILRTEPDAVRVQAGVPYERLNHHLGRRGRLFGPDPANSGATTLGGLISTDGAGSHWLKYGSARRHVRSLEVVLADGQVIEAGREPLENGRSGDTNPRKRELVDRLAELLRAQADTIRARRPKSVVNRCGYILCDILGDDHLDLAKLLVGSEGTLALVTEATLATQPLPRHRGVALLMFDSIDKASRAVREIMPYRPSACDLMDRRHLSLAREAEVRFDLLIPREAEAALLADLDGDEAWEVRDRMRRLTDFVRRMEQGAFVAHVAFDAAEMELFWSLARTTRPVLYQMKGTTRPVPGVEDFAVPPEDVPEFLIRVQNLLKRHQITASLFCHAGQGEFHLEPFLDLGRHEDVLRLARLARELYDEVFQASGTIGGEHPCGRTRTSFVRRQYGELYEVFRAVKRIFDPQNLLNPGNVVGDDPDLLTENLRPMEPVVLPAASAPPAEVPEMRNLIELQLDWHPTVVADIAFACNGCGDCRSQGPDVRMCPIFRILPAEEASPRAKANLIRGILSGRLDLDTLVRSEFKAVADLCVHCQMCPLECPAALDIPKMMAEAKGAYVAAKGLSFSDWIATHLDLLAGIGSRFSTAANWALGNRRMRWLLEKTLGIAQSRKLPRLAPRSFIRRAARRRLTRPSRHSGNKVAYFVDTYANYYDVSLAQALVAVLEHNGVGVYVPPEQKQAGMAAIACGALDLGRRLARHNVEILAEAVRQGYHVVASEPAATLCLTREYPVLLDEEDARLVAANTSDACSFLWKLHTLGKLHLDLKPITAPIGYHMPCRLKALRVGSPGENLLRLIPGLNVQHIEEGCSGMAGTFGLRRENYRASLRAGWGLISQIRDPNLHAGATECSACKMQMEQGTAKPTVHPIKLLALSYGLIPETASPLTTPGQELITT
jgi:FAD/FMN-containing dehydrogenase/Fe-S oxidoreductase